jgi:protease I
MAANLHGCVLAILVAEGADADELKEFRKEFRQFGARVHFLGVEQNPVKAQDGSSFDVDVMADAVSAGYYDGIVIPGGHDSQALMRNDEELISLLQVFAELRRPIGAIGEGLTLLADAGLVAGRYVAHVPSTQAVIQSAGGLISHDAIVTDQLLITARDDAGLPEFCARFASQVESYRMRDYTDETSIESFPGSDPVSGSAI